MSLPCSPRSPSQAALFQRLATELGFGAAVAPEKGMNCLHCQRKMSVVIKILNGPFCCSDHRDAYLEVLNRLGLARLVEARARLTIHMSDDPGNPGQSKSSQDDVMIIQTRVCNEPDDLNRMFRRLKTESSQLLHTLA